MRRRLLSHLAVIAMVIGGPGACTGGGQAGGVDAAPVDAAPVDAAPVDAAPVDATPAPDGGAAFDFDLGHVDAIHVLERTATRALSVDTSAHWILWDLGTRAPVTAGDATCPPLPPGEPALPCAPLAALRADLLVIRTSTGLELRSATTGGLTAVITTDIWGHGAAADGSYVWVTTATGIRTWSAAGGAGVAMAGDYRNAKVFAAALELRIAAGPAGPGIIETIRVAGGVRSTISFEGAFHSWFRDGERFLSATGTLVRVYSLAGAQVALGMLPTVENLTGQGDHVWTYAEHTPGYPLRIYAASDLAVARQTFGLPIGTRVVPGGDTLGLFAYGPSAIDIVTLGAAITRGPTVPIPSEYLSAYGASAGGWLVGTNGGVVFTGTGTTVEPPLTRGKLLSMAGTPGGTAVFATESGSIYLLDVGDTTEVVREIPLRSSHVELSTDGATLVATGYLDGAQYHEDRALRVYATATGALQHRWPYAWSDYPTMFFDFSLARSGLVIAHAIMQWDGFGWSSRRILTRADGTVLSDHGPPLDFDVRGPIGLHRFSPSGARAAITPAHEALDVAQTFLYQDGQLVDAVDGAALGWLDEDRVLVARYRRDMTGAPYWHLLGTTVHAADGTSVATPMLPDLRPFDPSRPVAVPVGGGHLHVPKHNAVYDQHTGDIVWQGPAVTVGGAVAGDHVVYAHRQRVIVERFRP